MSRSNVTFHQVEEYWLSEERPPETNGYGVICSFETQRFGYLQIGVDEGEIYELKNEPDLNMFTKSDNQYIKNVAEIVWRMVFDVPAATDRFE